jgi:hypothetical protein
MYVNYRERGIIYNAGVFNIRTRTSGNGFQGRERYRGSIATPAFSAQAHPYNSSSMFNSIPGRFNLSPGTVLFNR